MSKRQHSLAIENKEIVDDYHNHFVSHFGFYDERRSNNFEVSKYYKCDQALK